MKLLIAQIINKLNLWSRDLVHTDRLKNYKNISKLASIGVDSSLIGPVENIHIGEHTYINLAQINCGKKSLVKIGTGCAIGYNVSIKSKTHSIQKPTNNQDGPIKHIEKNIIIGNDCWVGDNVFIREGVKLGNNVIVGANSVVTKSFDANSIIVGVPARLLKISK